MTDHIWLDVSLTQLAAQPGGPPVSAVLVARNDGPLVDELVLGVAGLDTAWYTLSQPSVSLMPGASANVRLELRIPLDTPTGHHPFHVHASSTADPSQSADVEAALEVATIGSFEVEVLPARATARRSALYAVRLRNSSNADRAVRLMATDEADALRYRLEPDQVVLAAGAEATASLRVEPISSRWAGRSQAFQFKLIVLPADDPTSPPLAARSGEFVQAPLVPVLMTGLAGARWWAMLAIPLLVAIALLVWVVEAPGTPPVRPIAAPPVATQAVQAVSTPSTVAPPAATPAPAVPTVASAPGTSLTPPVIASFGLNLNLPLQQGRAAVPLAWDVRGADETRLEQTGGDTGPSRDFRPIESSEYTLLASNAAGRTSQSFTVYVLRPPAIQTFEAEVVQIGSSLRLTWRADRANRVYLNDQLLASAVGTLELPYAANAQYVLRAENAAGVDQRQLHLAPPAQPSQTPTPSPTATPAATAQPSPSATSSAIATTPPGTAQPAPAVAPETPVLTHTPTLTATPTPSSTATFTPTATTTPTSTATSTSTPTPTATSTSTATPTTCPPIALLQFSAQVEGSVVRVEWSARGGCGPYTGVVTAHYTSAGFTRDYPVTALSGSVADSPPQPGPNSTSVVNYTLDLRDSASHTNANTSASLPGPDVPIGDGHHVPAISASATTLDSLNNIQPYAAGAWTNQSVTVNFVCSYLPGDGTCADSQTIWTEGSNMVVSGKATWGGGGETETTFGPINIDTTLPATAATVDPPPDSLGWISFSPQRLALPSGSVTMPTGPDSSSTSQPGTVVLHLSASDAVSGVQSISYKTLEGSAVTLPQTTITVTATDLPVVPVGEVVTPDGITSIVYWATDHAGNVSQTTQVDIRVDSAAPTIAQTATTADGSSYAANGWTNQDVTVVWTCSDALSGMSRCPERQTFTNSNAGIARALAVDNAGNWVVTPDFGLINIDKSQPSTEATLDPAPNSLGWISFPSHGYAVPENVAVGGAGNTLMVFNASTTPASGDPSTFFVIFSVHNGTWTASEATFARVTIMGASPETISVLVDELQSGQDAALRAGPFSLDADKSVASAQIVVGTSSVTTTYQAGTVIVHLTASDDGGSGIQDITFYSSYSPYHVSPGVVSMPKTTVHAATADVHVVAPGSTFTPEGITTITYWASDTAGNVGEAKQVVIQVDNSAPQLTASATTLNGQPYLPGTWSNQAITVSYICTDLLSGVSACPEPENFPVGSPGVGNVAVGNLVTYARDNAGNTASDTASGVLPHGIASGVVFGPIALDATPPTLTASAWTLDSDGNRLAYEPGSWTNRDVTVSLAAADDTNGSGIKSMTYGASGAQPIAETTETDADASFVISGEGQTIVTFWAADNAGNGGVATQQSVVVSIDKTPPVIAASAETADGEPYTERTWTNQDVTVTFTCSDSLSGIFTCPIPLTQSTSFSVGGLALDNAGNWANAEFDNVNIDKTAPTSTATVSPTPGPSGNIESLPATVSIQAADNGPAGGSSGVRSITYSVNGGPWTSVNAASTSLSISFGRTVIGYFATDNARNSEAVNLATYTVSQPTLTVHVDNIGASGGTVTSSPSGITSCGTTCTALFNLGTVVTLTAVPDSESQFDQWTGCTAIPGSLSQCTVDMTAPREITATFSRIGPRVVVHIDSIAAGAGVGGPQPLVGLARNVGSAVGLPVAGSSLEGGSPRGTGLVTIAPPGIQCRTDCASTADLRTQVTLTASADPGSRFAGWSGDVPAVCRPTSGSLPGTCAVTMDQSRAVVASFKLVRTLSVSIAGNGRGSVTSQPAGISCPPDCSAAFDDGTKLSLTAHPDQTSAFSGWSGPLTGGSCPSTATGVAQPCDIAVLASGGVAATFRSDPTFTPTPTFAGSPTATTTVMVVASPTVGLPPPTGTTTPAASPLAVITTPSEVPPTSAPVTTTTAATLTATPTDLGPGGTSTPVPTSATADATPTPAAAIPDTTPQPTAGSATPPPGPSPTLPPAASADSSSTPSPTGQPANPTSIAAPLPTQTPLPAATSTPAPPAATPGSAATPAPPAATSAPPAVTPSTPSTSPTTPPNDASTPAAPSAPSQPSAVVPSRG